MSMLNIRLLAAFYNIVINELELLEDVDLAGSAGGVIAGV